MTTEERLSAKQLSLRAIESLPDDATIEDAIDTLVLVFKVEQGLDQARRGILIPHEEVRKQFEQWLR